MTPVVSKPGTLYIVATPIGNLNDITLRAKEILSQVDLIAAEDTRHSARLLNALAISTPLVSLHEHNESSQAIVIIDKIKKGSDLALISDAGTPLISDPGYRLVDLAYENNLKVVPIPGPSSVIAALSAAGISTDAFSFIGFLPARSNQRKQTLTNYKDETKTLVIFESPHRILKSLDDMVTVFGEDRKVSFCRELTKQFETILRGSLGELKDAVESDPNQRRGEIVLVVRGCDNPNYVHENLEYQGLVKGMLEHMPTKTVAVLLAKHTGLSRKHFYDMALKLIASS